MHKRINRLRHRFFRHVFLALAVFAILLLGSTARAPGASAQGSAPTYVSGQLIVRYKNTITTLDRDAVEARRGDQKIREFKNIPARVVKIGANRTVEQAVQEYKRDATVEYAEPNYIVRATDGPNDPQYAMLWGMKNSGQIVEGIAGKAGADIKAEQAWAITTGSASIVVGVVDSGVDYSHPDLTANIWSNPGNIGGCSAGTHGYDTIADVCDPTDDNGHGTHVSGTIGAVGNNALGVVGVNWKTQIMGLKFLDSSGSGSVADAIDAIDFAITAKAAGVNVRVLNNSWGGSGFSQALLDEINKAGASGILFVVSAGNNSANVDSSPTYPCGYSATNLICVAATDSNDNLASFSNYGRTSVDLSAPGKNILSTIPGSSYAYYNGTSMATPHVSGAAALILSAPGQSGLTVDQLKSAILNNVDSISGLSGITSTGGRLNICKAIPGCSDSITPTPTATKPTSTFTPSPTSTFTPSPTSTFTRSPTSTFTPSPTSTFTRSPTSTFTRSPTYTVTPPTTTPYPAPPATTTSTPTSTPTTTATLAPTADFALAANPFSQTINAGASANYLVAIRSLNGFNSPVTLSVSGLPTGATATFSVNPLTPATLGTLSTLKIATSATTPSGMYALTITGKAANGANAAHSITVFLNVNSARNFRIALNERWLIVRRNSQSTIVTRVIPSGGFNASVSLSATGLPPWITATFNPNPVPFGPNGGATFLTFATGNSYGAFVLSIVGTAEGQTQSAPLLIIVW
ncbi:MAG: S8 family serine peptidase [Chloroflexota bacterium]